MTRYSAGMIAADQSEDRAEALLAGLTSEQRDAVTTTASPLCIIAGAGSGKTRVLTRRVAWQSVQGNIDPRRVLVLTFTRRAASELRSRLRSLGMRDAVAAGTFHSAALALLRRYWDHCERPHMKLLASRYSFLAKTIPQLDTTTIAALNTEISWARARLITPERYADEATQARRRPPRSADFTASAYAAYQEAKNTRRLIDFDDVLALCHGVLTKQPLSPTRSVGSINISLWTSFKMSIPFSSRSCGPGSVPSRLWPWWAIQIRPFTASTVPTLTSSAESTDTFPVLPWCISEPTSVRPQRCSPLPPGCSIPNLNLLLGSLATLPQ